MFGWLIPPGNPHDQFHQPLRLLLPHIDLKKYVAYREEDVWRGQRRLGVDVPICGTR